MNPIYLDHSATTPVHPEVLAAMISFFANHFGNPSSIHREGRLAREAVEGARARVAVLIGAAPAEIVFTGGGTEADNLAVLGAAFAQKGGRNHLMTSAIEHHAVENACRHLAGRGFAATFLPVDGEGRVNPDDVRKGITEKTFLISVMHANNEIGTIQPLREIGAIARERGVLFHTDAVQSVGKIPVAVEDLGVDLLSIAGHKIYGPKGTGALYVRKGTELAPITFGGHQEGNLRNGTENVPGIVGFGVACEIALRDLASQMTRLRMLRNLLEERIRAEIPDIRVHGHPRARLPHLLSISFAGVSGESLVRELDLRGIAVSAGSACTAGSTKISHVLAALGMPEALAVGAVRFSLGRDNTEEEIGRAVSILKALVEKRRILAELEGSVGGRGCR
ncbi:MAG: cysteine desulfurase family protein [Deltaproteobacteria bacterium]|nr:cysteine desulfurase family protein [Deltaproteobacteria bacterium]